MGVIDLRTLVKELSKHNDFGFDSKMVQESWGSKWETWEHGGGGFCEISFFNSVVHGRLSSLVLLLEKPS